MARRYDSSTTTFSPEGRLHQVEYAIEAINNAGTCVGILAKDGIVMASEKRITSGLLAPAKVNTKQHFCLLHESSFSHLYFSLFLSRWRKTSEKTYKLCPHVACNVAGLTADANILMDEARLRAGRYRYQYQEPIPVEKLVEHICNHKQSYTQYGGLRPFGVAFLFAGYDSKHGFQLYQSDPSGNYSGWKATVIGANNQAGKSLLKTEYNEPDTKTALELAVKVLHKTMDGTAAASAEKMELFCMTLADSDDDKKKEPECVHHILTTKEAQEVLDAVAAESASAGDS
eukprot:CAMPEP_0116843706 /NCGR_PEP_ID=MMETSP0418-20121206/12241_1 /TAXON_ID=1158023 /ORGANISM="Astrosyne radiata, Strain 13vi08-1A" /LENGTH=286 /DNA_ID=CAMNT_0004474497 /DNA_START=58 /DNA_END=918 /DNA_ORIENTATION=-